MTFRIARSVFLLAFANLGFALASTCALEHALPTVHNVKPCCLPHGSLQRDQCNAMQGNHATNKQTNSTIKYTTQFKFPENITIHMDHCTLPLHIALQKLQCNNGTAKMALQQFHCTLHYTMCCTSVAQTKVTTHVGAYPLPMSPDMFI